MRCLRCAIDYGPDERFCERCGRGLSHPPGSKAAGEGDPFSTLQDTAFLYSTFSPPASTQQATATAEPDSYPLPVQSPPTTRLRARAALPPVDQPEIDRYEAEEEVAPPSHAPLGIANRPIRELGADPDMDGDQPDATDVLSAFDVRSSTIGIDVRSWRQTAAATKEVAGARAKLPRLRIPPTILVAVLALAVVAALAFMALGKYNTYDKDVKAAQALVAQGQYAAAIDRYQKAIQEWPRNQSAKDEQASAQATVAAAQAQATATALQVQAAAAARSQRADIFKAWQQQRAQAGQQADAQASASPTPQSGQ